MTAQPQVVVGAKFGELNTTAELRSADIEEFMFGRVSARTSGMQLPNCSTSSQIAASTARGATRTGRGK